MGVNRCLKATSRGFTLLETLAVIIIIGVTTTVITSAIVQHNKNHVVEKKVTAVVEIVRKARMLAMSSGQTQILGINLTSKHIEGHGRQVPFSLDEFDITMKAAEEFGPAFVFFPNGCSSGGSLILTNDYGRWEIRVDWVTGVVELRRDA